MKKLFSVLLLSSFCINALAYTTWDVGTADYLAERGIIRDFRHEVSGYRLDAVISRQEVVGIAMKMAGKTAPNGYICQGYFSDAKFAKNHPDAWVCASLEMAANDGIVSRANAKFRPKASITRIEALAIIMKAAGYDITPNVTIGFNDKPISNLYGTRIPQWQIDVIESAHVNGIIDAYTDNFSPDQVFLPNKPATRAEVFGFAYQVLVKEDGAGTGGTGQSVVTPQGDGTQTYVSASGDFRFTFPTTLAITEEEVSKGNYTTAILGEGESANGGSLYFEVTRTDCLDTCADQYDLFYANFKTELQKIGFNLREASDGLLEFTYSENKNGVVQIAKWYGGVVVTREHVYTIAVSTEEAYWNTNRRTLLQMMASFHQE